MTRRLLLQGLLLGVWSKTTGAAHGAAGQFRTTSGLQPAQGVADERARPTSPLSSAERETLLAFGELVVEGRALSPAARRDFSGSIENGMTSIPAQIAYYRKAVKLLDRLAGMRFARLDV